MTARRSRARRRQAGGTPPVGPGTDGYELALAIKRAIEAGEPNAIIKCIAAAEPRVRGIEVDDPDRGALLLVEDGGREQPRPIPLCGGTLRTVEAMAAGAAVSARDVLLADDLEPGHVAEAVWQTCTGPPPSARRASSRRPTVCVLIDRGAAGGFRTAVYAGLTETSGLRLPATRMSALEAAVATRALLRG